MIIGVIYRPPNTHFSEFNEDIGDLLQRLNKWNEMCYLMGDFYINLFNHGMHDYTSCFIDTLHAHSFRSLISRPTRVTEKSATLIDNILLIAIRILKKHFSVSVSLILPTTTLLFTLIATWKFTTRRVMWHGDISTREINNVSASQLHH